MKGLTRDLKRSGSAHPLVCKRCKLGGGTLTKIGDDTYQHQTREDCKTQRKLERDRLLAAKLNVKMEEAGVS